MKKIVNSCLICCFLFTLSGCSFFSNDIYLIYTNDVHCSLDESMNYANVKAIKNDLKEYGSTLLIDGGDFLQGNDFNNISENIVQLMNETGYDVVTLGNHEFDFGIAQLEKILKNAKFNIITSNIDFIDNNYLNKKVLDYKIINIGTKKIGFIGVITPDLLKIGTDSEKQLRKDDCYEVDIYGDINDLDDDGSLLIVRIQEIIDKIKEKVDYVVVISHLGINYNQVLSSYDLIQHTTDVDVVLDAHSHSVVNEIRVNKDGEDVYLLSTGFNMNNIGIFKISQDGSFESFLINEYRKDEKLQNEINKLLSIFD